MGSIENRERSEGVQKYGATRGATMDKGDLLDLRTLVDEMKLKKEMEKNKKEQQFNLGL